MRIRTTKPEFWDDDTIGSLSREARLLFLCTWNLADDEGILRWTSAFLKANAFIYDEDVDERDVQRFMDELAAADLVYPYVTGKARQSLALVVNFRKHQKINRPTPPKLPPPSLHNPATVEMYLRRDRYVCHLCGEPIPTEYQRSPSNLYDSTDSKPSTVCLNPSMDHVVPRSAGGGDYPSNIKVAHLGCNQGRCNRELAEFSQPATVAGALRWLRNNRPDSLLYSVEESVTDSLSEVARGVANGPNPDTVGEIHSLSRSVSDSVPEGKGREGNREGSRTSSPEPASPPREDVSALCDRLHEKVSANGAKAVITKQWRDEARRLLDLDKRDPDQALRLIDWATGHHFWRTNILSMPTFRRQYDKLLLQARSEQEKAKGSTSTRVAAVRSLYRPEHPELEGGAA